METRNIFVSLVMADLTAEIFRVRGTLLGVYIALDLQHGAKLRRSIYNFASYNCQLLTQCMPYGGNV